MMWNYGMDGWNWLWMGGVMVLFWGGVVLLAIWAIRSLSGSHRTDDAMETLRRRLAAGEISPEDFEKTKRALG